MESARILMVGDDGQFSDQLAKQVQVKNVRLIETPDKANALRLTHTKKPHLVLIHSTSREHNDGLDIAAQIRKANPLVPIIFVTRHSSEERAIAALRVGVNDYYRSPFKFDQLVDSLKSHLGRLQQSAQPIKHTVNLTSLQKMIGQSQRMREIRSFLLKVAATESTVLITGETGTGKGLAAWLIHQNSRRWRGPFVPVNCPAIPDSLVESELFGFEKGAFTGALATTRGKFERACNGTLFLDEISDMGLLAQAKILRTIEDKENFRIGGKGGVPLDVRVVAATNQPPEQLLADGKLRKDLFYRLNVARIQLPPLRERKEDIPSLTEHFVRTFNQAFGKEIAGVTDKVSEALLQYDWPGNVRQFKNLLEASFIHTNSSTIHFADLPVDFRIRRRCGDGDAATERERIIAALIASKGNKSKAAQKLKWSRMTLYRKLSKYRLDNPMPSKQIA